MSDTMGVISGAGTPVFVGIMILNL